MLDPANGMLPPLSPSDSSISSSDLDTESTGSFFHDRSTTLGTLMGVTFPAITFRAPSQQHHPAAPAPAGGSGTNHQAGRMTTSKKNKKSETLVAIAEWRRRRRRRAWWRLCRDGGAKPASLGEFLEVERRFGDSAVALYSDNAAAAAAAAEAELEGVMVGEQPSSSTLEGRLLFADGRVLPPADAVDDDDDDGSSTAGALCRFPVSLSGICSGGIG